MTLRNSSNQKTFKNTFAPHIRNETLDVQAIVAGLRTTLIHSEDLPKEVQDAVVDELERLAKTRQGGA